MIAAGAVALGFGGYLASFMGLTIVPIAVLLIAASVLILILGVKETVWIGIIFTLIEAGGLLIVIGVSAPLNQSHFLAAV